MKYLSFIFISLILISGCANRYEHYSRHHYKHYINISDQQHTNYVASIIMKKIDSRSAQVRGYVYISSRWFLEQGLDDSQTNLIYNYFTGLSYHISLNEHERHQIGSWDVATNNQGFAAGDFTIENIESNDILISW